MNPRESHAISRTIEKSVDGVRFDRTPSRQVDQVESPVNPSCGLDKPGWWTARHQRPIPIRWYKSTEYCRYSGRLPSDEASAVARMWTVITMLGREGQ